MEAPADEHARAAMSCYDYYYYYCYYYCCCYLMDDGSRDLEELEDWILAERALISLVFVHLDF
jgi:hypothetical protein